MTVLEGQDLTKIYGGKSGLSSTMALNGVNIKIKQGEFIGVMGPSGSGKTTLLNVLSGIDKVTSGSVKIARKNIHEMDFNELALFRRRKMGFVFQEFNLLNSLTIKENVLLPMILDKKDVSEMERKLAEVLTLFDIADIAEKYPYNVSGGQQQRAAVSRALVNEPVIVFADEPTGNLDSASSKAVMKCLETMNQKKGTTILMVTHDPFAASYCQRIVFIKDGGVHSEIVKTGGKKEFFEKILDCLAIVGGVTSDF